VKDLTKEFRKWTKDYTMNLML